MVPMFTLRSFPNPRDNELPHAMCGSCAVILSLQCCMLSQSRALAVCRNMQDDLNAICTKLHRIGHCRKHISCGVWIPPGFHLCAIWPWEDTVPTRYQSSTATKPICVYINTSLLNCGFLAQNSALFTLARPCTCKDKLSFTTFRHHLLLLCRWT